jgi:hypothetical protein
MGIGEELLKVSNILARDGISINNVVAVHESEETPDHLSRNMAIDSCNVDLLNIALNKRVFKEGKKANLYKSFCLISCPLSEILAIGEAT